MIAAVLPFPLERVASWLATFALHSTAVLAFAWLLSLVLARRLRGFQERLLRFSLWAAVVSASLQTFWLGAPPALAIPLASPVVAAAAEALASIEPTQIDAPALVLPRERSTPHFGTSPALSWAELTAGGAAVLALVGLAWLLLTALRLRGVLARRCPEEDPRVLAAAAEAARAAGWRQTPQLSRCDDLATPIAFGWLRPEICLPARAAELSTPSLRALLAHELAHLRAGDAMWMWCGAWLQALFPWQFLLPIVRRRWTNLVELRCDAEAARHASPTAVARCLIDVAEWLQAGARSPAIALGMAARPSALRQRVEAALQPQAADRPSRLLGIAFAGASLTALATAAPGVHCREPGRSVRIAEVPGAAEVADTAAGDSGVAVEAAATSARVPLDLEVQAVEAEFAALQADIALVQARYADQDDPDVHAVLTALDARVEALAELREQLLERLAERSNQPR